MEMKRHSWWLGIGLIVGAGCSTQDAHAVDDGMVGFRDLLDITGEVCPGWRQVVRRPDGNCVDIGNVWKGSSMLGDGADGVFAQYCVYQHTGTPTQDDVDQFQAHGAFASAANDCLVVQPQGALIEQLNPPLRDLTVDRLDLVDDSEISGTKSERAPVFVAVVDTTPRDDPPDPRSDHGLAVATLIDDIAHGCSSPSPSCNVFVENELALPRFGFGKKDRDPLNGGYAGFKSEAARGAFRAMKDWEAIIFDPGIPEVDKPKLVVNLSLAWLPIFGGEDPTNSSPAVEAFYRVLVRLNCEGALVVAAAGNDKDDCGENGMLPAAWEEQLADVDQCDAVDVTSPVTSPASYQPVVHSVGGVTWDGEAIGPTRENGRPRLAALGASVVGPDLTRGPLTGTSMSAAAVSGIAALVWSYNRSLTSHELAEIIWSSGKPTGDTADYGLPGQLQEIREATACRALEAACLQTQACSLARECRSVELPTDHLGDVIAGVKPDSPELDVEIELQSLGDCEWYCEESPETFSLPGVQDKCLPPDAPERIDYLTMPQPDNPACTSCTWVTTNTGQTSQQTKILGTRADQYDGWALLGATVEFTYEDGTDGQFVLGPLDLRAFETLGATLKGAPAKAIDHGTITLTLQAPTTGNVVTNSDPLVEGVAR